MSSRGKTLVLLLSLALTSMGIEIARADSFTWTTISTSNLSSSYGSKSIAMSSDGSTIIVGRDTDGVYLSTNSGTNYSKISTTSIPNGSYFVSISADGTKMLAGSNATNIPNFYYSIDSGSTWTAKVASGTTPTIRDTCMSGNGSRWMILNTRGAYTSTDNGATWSYILGTGPDYWTCAMSNDATKIFVLPFGTALKYSTDSGANWSTSTNTYLSANIIASSSDGSKLVLTDRDALKIYMSTDFGATFTQKFLAVGSLQDAAISSDGSRIAVAVAGRLLTSIDGGTNWVQEMTPSSLTWGAVAMNASGSKVIASPSGGTGVSYQGIIPSPATLSLQSISPSASPLIYRTSYTLSALSNAAGKVTFYANGKKITKCSQVPTVSLVATCIYAPSIHGVITITAAIAPSDSSYLAGTSRLLQTSAIVRTTKR
ncbi:Sialidase_non-viral domain containing protein [Candidatus Nanopelagicaceae bacterium]